VLIYRLLQYTLNHVLVEELGPEGSDRIFQKAGWLSGSEFAKNLLDLEAPFDQFIVQLQKQLKDLKIGILRMERYNEADGSFILTIGEDLDCSGLPPTNEVVCNYDEGFLKGIMDVYTHKNYEVKEIDCWASGDRVCRFQGTVIKDES